MIAGVVGDVVGVVVLLVGVAVLVGLVRVRLRRPVVAVGDAALAAVVETMVGRRATRVAAVVVADGIERTAYVAADARSRFELGSVSKALTGLLLGTAVGDGTIGLDEELAALDSRLAGSPLGAVTVEAVCTHRSGLPTIPFGMALRVAGFGLFGLNPYGRVDDSSVLRAARRQSLRAGEQYANLGGAVLGQAIAARLGTTYADALRERVLSPLGMDATGVAGADVDAAPRGWSRHGRRPRPWVMPGFAPAGGVVGTPGDLARLLHALLAGTAPGDVALEPSRPSTLRPGAKIGMFWVTSGTPGAQLTWHNGQTGGYGAYVAIETGRRAGVAVLLDVADADLAERLGRRLLAA